MILERRMKGERETLVCCLFHLFMCSVVASYICPDQRWNLIPCVWWGRSNQMSHPDRVHSIILNFAFFSLNMSWRSFNVNTHRLPSFFDSMHSIPCNGCLTDYLNIPILVDVELASSFFAVTGNAVMPILVRMYVVRAPTFTHARGSVGDIPRNGMADSQRTHNFSFDKTLPHCFPKLLFQFMRSRTEHKNTCCQQERQLMKNYWLR